MQERGYTGNQNRTPKKARAQKYGGHPRFFMRIGLIFLKFYGGNGEKYFVSLGYKKHDMLESMKKGGGKKKINSEPIKTISKKTVSKTPVGKAPSKEEVESKIGRIKELAKDVEDKRQGEAEFGKDYEDLGLKLKSTGIKRVGDDLERNEKGEVKFRRTFSGKEDGVSETVTKEYGGDLLKVKRTAPKAYGIGTETEEFVETPQGRKKRVYEIGKLRVMKMMSEAQKNKNK